MCEGSRLLRVKPDVDSTQEYQGERTTKCIVNSGKTVSLNFNNPKAATNNTSAVGGNYENHESTYDFYYIDIRIWM